MNNELLKFKHVLEYFVAHMNYLQSSESSEIKGYDQYIKPLIDNQTFKYTGQGYNGDSIQNQISEWDIYSNHSLFINIQPNFGNYTSKKCYLNWEGTGINIYCKWNGKKVIGLSIGYAFWWEKPIEYKIIRTESIDKLKLYRIDDEFDLLKDFYVAFFTEIKDYDNEQGEYYNKEKVFKMKEKYVNYLNLLKSNHNLILTGAPGTGKTYLAKQIAAQIILGKEYDEKASSDEEKEKMKNQSAFVQFHPSYDYTDFVEGLRPIKDGDKLGFQRKDGVFKDFCKKALLYSNKDFEILHSRIIEGIKKETYTTYKGPNSEPKRLGIKIDSSKNEQILFRANTDNSKTENTELMKKIFNHLVDQKIFDISSYNSADFDNLAKEVTNNQINRVDFAEYKWIMTVLLDLYNKPFVFIIDEINRGEISKIFGELFYSIDPGYRGEKGKVETQYQNLILKDDVFRNGFFVPENVYIIGTMNDIDRSVESMDFAMRRRFAWKEIKAEDTLSMLDDEKAWDGYKPKQEIIEEIKKRMNHLNNCIIDKDVSGKDQIGLTKAYQIGASYFLKLKYYLDNGAANEKSWENLWNNHLEGLLREYLRGTTNIDAKIDRLKTAFDNTTKHNETTKN